MSLIRASKRQFLFSAVLWGIGALGWLGAAGWWCSAAEPKVALERWAFATNVSAAMR